MSKKILCKSCMKYLGEIHEAKLRKNIVFLCEQCEVQRKALELRYKNNSHDDYMDSIKDIFGGVF